MTLRLIAVLAGLVAGPVLAAPVHGVAALASPAQPAEPVVAPLNSGAPQASADEDAPAVHLWADEAFEAFVLTMRERGGVGVADLPVLRAISDEASYRGRWAADLYAVLLRTGYERASDLGSQFSGTGARSAFAVSHPSMLPRVRYVELMYSDALGWHFDPERMDWVSEASRQLADVPPAEAVMAELPLVERLHYRLRTELPASMTARAFVLENWQWVAIAVLLALCVVIDKVVQLILGSMVRRAAGAESLAKLAPELGRFVRPGGLFVGAVLFAQLLPIVGLSGQVQLAVAFAAELVATFAGLWSIYRLVDLGCGVLEARARASENRFDDLLVPLLKKTLRILVVVVGFVYLAASWTDELWSIIAGLSIGSLAIGFAARDSIENLFGTFTVLTDKPFALGDWIVVDGIEGTVESVGFRSTRIRTFYDSLMSIPNRKFISGVVDNYGRRGVRRVKTTLRLTVDTPPEVVDAFCEGVRQLIRNHPHSADRSFHVYLNDLGSDSLDVMLYTFLDTPDWAVELRERHRLLGDILRLARELGVKLSLPTQAVAVDSDGAAAAAPAIEGDAEAHGRALADAIAAPREA